MQLVITLAADGFVNHIGGNGDPLLDLAQLAGGRDRAFDVNFRLRIGRFGHAGVVGCSGLQANEAGVVGILGAGVAGLLAPRLGLYTESFGGNIVASLLGALVLLLLIGLVRRI